MSPTERFLDRLDGVKKTGPDKYLARCPAHDDKSPSLSIRDCGDTFLMKCWSGCASGDVMTAVGLKLSDFWERAPDKPSGHKRVYVSAKEVVEIISTEMWIVIAAASAMLDDSLTFEDYERLHDVAPKMQQILEKIENG